ncbi:MAG TPA: RNA-binding protein [archaeon]|jgi:exosome complex component RRP4|nr:RNA-binding protein [archaeon]HPC10042.1 RNA-binding protein [archaeon]HRT02399.1 RNA-binding protein [Candidatus Diapherotrites archaeon]
MDKKIVVPGEFLTDLRKKMGPNVYQENGKIYSSVVGILSETEDSVSVIALNGSYINKQGDGVIGIVKSETPNGYFLEYNSPYELYIPKNAITKELKIGDIIFARIKEITSYDSVEIDNINVLPKGNIYVTSCVKVPRLIGKNNSMIDMLKQYTQSNIVIGKNGLIWYTSKKPELLEKAFQLIINNSQKSNLTDNIKKFLENTNSEKI